MRKSAARSLQSPSKKLITRKAQSPDPSTGGRKIIIVDDDEGILDALEAMLAIEGYEIIKSSDGESLENLNKNNLPNLILLDVLLSGNDGREICAKLKKSELTKHVPVIMISADPTAEKGVKNCGADDFIAKPFEINYLLDKIANYLNAVD